MGKVLIEKLLYSVPDIGKVYVLMRPKRGKSVAQRLEDIQRLAVRYENIRYLLLLHTSLISIVIDHDHSSSEYFLL